MQKEPRGGGRDRDQIVRHVFAAEQGWAKMVGLLTAEGVMLTAEGLAAHRSAYVHAIHEYHAQGGLRAK